MQTVTPDNVCNIIHLTNRLSIPFPVFSVNSIPCIFTFFNRVFFVYTYKFYVCFFMKYIYRLEIFFTMFNLISTKQACISLLFGYPLSTTVPKDFIL